MVGTICLLVLQAKEQFRKNIRYKAAHTIRTQARHAYGRFVEQAANKGSVITMNSLCEGEIADDIAHTAVSTHATNACYQHS